MKGPLVSRVGHLRFPSSGLRVVRITAIPHNALGQEITSDCDQRRLVFMVAKIFQASSTCKSPKWTDGRMVKSRDVLVMNHHFWPNGS